MAKAKRPAMDAEDRRDGGADEATEGKRKKSKAKPKGDLGSGERFKALVASLSKRPGVSNPSAVAASIGRKKYGAVKFNGLAKRGK